MDVQGGISLKSKFKSTALSVFVMPPNLEVLEHRLRMRKTETEEKIKQRIEKAEYEMKLSNEFDVVINNDNLENAIDEAKKLIHNFIRQ